jgi:hypothetical protein
MKRSKQIADRLREVVLNGLWIANTNYKDQLSGLTWQQATTQVGSLNTIAKLTFHINYYLGGIVQVLEGGPLDIRDKYSFDLPPVNSQEDWEKLANTLWHNAEKFADLVERLPDEKLDDAFVDEKYGTWQRNIDAMIEHCYYHLGQITLIRKMLSE